MIFSGGPLNILAGLWAALAGALAHRLSRRRLPASLLTGALVAAWPRVEEELHARHVYFRLMAFEHRLLRPYYERRHRRDREEHEEERRATVERLGFDPYEPVGREGPPRELATLLRVIAVGQAQRTENGTLMLLSVESYEEGCVVRGRLVLDGEPDEPEPFDPRTFPPYPSVPTLVLRDDLGGRYAFLGGSSSGGDRHYSYDFEGRPPLDLEARELELEVPEIRWERHEGRRMRSVIDRVEAGPWTFRVSL